MLTINFTKKRFDIDFGIKKYILSQTLNFVWFENMKNGIHGQYFQDVTINCICGAEFAVNTTVKGPIRVETCHQCHPTFNKDKVIKKVVKGRMEQFLEKQKRIDAAKKSA